MSDLITVATLAADLRLSLSAVRLRAARLGIEKVSDRLYLFTPEQAELIRQAKSTPGKTPLPEGQITRSALSKRRRRARERGNQTMRYAHYFDTEAAAEKFVEYCQNFPWLNGNLVQSGRKVGVGAPLAHSLDNDPPAASLLVHLASCFDVAYALGKKSVTA